MLRTALEQQRASAAPQPVAGDEESKERIVRALHRQRRPPAPVETSSAE
jgi:hypothetical protein